MIPFYFIKKVFRFFHNLLSRLPAKPFPIPYKILIFCQSISNQLASDAYIAIQSQNNKQFIPIRYLRWMHYRHAIYLFTNLPDIIVNKAIRFYRFSPIHNLFTYIPRAPYSNFLFHLHNPPSWIALSYIGNAAYPFSVRSRSAP